MHCGDCLNEKRVFWYYPSPWGLFELIEVETELTERNSMNCLVCQRNCFKVDEAMLNVLYGDAVKGFLKADSAYNLVYPKYIHRLDAVAVVEGEGEGEEDE